jgi:hypothetical protein
MLRQLERCEPQSRAGGFRKREATLKQLSGIHADHKAKI